MFVKNPVSALSVDNEFFEYEFVDGVWIKSDSKKEK